MIRRSKTLNMSQFRQDELLAYLYQYPEKKKKLNDAMLRYRSVQFDSVRTSGGSTADSVLGAVIGIDEDDELKNAQNDIEYIEQSARLIEGGRWYDALIAHFCYQKPYSLIPIHLLPTCHRSSFYDATRAFMEQINRKDWYMVKD